MYIGHMILKKTILEGSGHDDSGAILGKTAKFTVSKYIYKYCWFMTFV